MTPRKRNTVTRSHPDTAVQVKAESALRHVPLPYREHHIGDRLSKRVCKGFHSCSSVFLCFCTAGPRTTCCCCRPSMALAGALMLSDE